MEVGRGGSGAGPDWKGQNCVHVHMTNVSNRSYYTAVLVGLLLIWG